MKVEKATGQKTLTDAEITARRPARRAFLGLVAASGAALAVPSSAQAADVDTGNWTDAGSCPRGNPGGYTGYTDHDNGRITDRGGHGRGQPYC
ncbi:MAG: hypothetical protein R6U99_08110 [Nioella sp.]|uniref:hypothetical protein n=1 Tax=Nioella halotolerans TaxID=2303578 RepID=UPI0026A507E0